MEVSQGGPLGRRIYRFGPWFVFVYRLQAATAILFGLILLARYSETLWKPYGLAIPNWVAGVVLLLGAAYLLARQYRSAVITDSDSVSLRGVWSTRSRPRDAILGSKITWNCGIAYITLVPKSSGESPLTIERFYAFDEEWKNWIASLPDLNQKHTLG